ncbi:hypothetical protein JR316_0003641 [Psilocybe cubensis]|uniref:Mid2 domain-containing protein n=2 Tax=Psilocybe cubensis TaxID=181762 RepID=A0A8H7Y2F4_PSICU|nr:hypothetical protein JR316_0003641 [Psilocybe cubensis]KAH9484161.1 hypothetical protein JR316_0003641 [Psilocybe cubensis]
MRPTSVHSAVTTSTVSVQPPSLPSTPVANGNNFGSSSTFTPSESISLSSLSSISSPIASHSDPESSAPHQSSSSYSVITFSTTNENGYTIDVTSTSFFMPLSTNSASNGGSINNAKTDSTSAASKGANVRAIVGGIVGAITFILLLLFAIWTIRRRKKNRMAPSSEFIRSYGTPFGSGSESRFRHLDDSTYDADAQSISNFPFETALSHGTQESYRSYFHQTREKSDIN